MPSRHELSNRENQDYFLRAMANEINKFSGCINTYVRPHMPAVSGDGREVTDIGVSARTIEPIALRLGLGPCHLTLIEPDEPALQTTAYTLGVVQDSLPPRSRLPLTKITYVAHSMFGQGVLPANQDVIFFGNIHPKVIEKNGIEASLKATKPGGLVAITSLAFIDWQDVQHHIQQLHEQGLIEILHNESIDPPLVGQMLGDGYITVIRKKAQQAP